MKFKKGKRDFKYDETSITSILDYARMLKGKTISDVVGIEKLENRKDKGMVGNALQEHYFKIPRNSSSEPDFSGAGLELKCFGFWSDGEREKADQRLALTDINFMEFAAEIAFEDSHLYQKCHNMLWIAYLMKLNQARIDSEIKYVRLYEFEKVVASDMRQIKKDYDVITKKIREGKASQLSEGDTEYLGAARTGNKESNKQNAPLGDEALPRRFVFKQSYMSYLVKEYIIPEKEFGIKISKVKEKNCIKIPKGKTFEDWLEIIDRKYMGKAATKIAKLKKIRDIKGIIDFERKNSFSELGYAMLGIASNKDIYLQKTNTVVKAVRIKQNGIAAESSPFPNFRIMDIVNQEWVESDMFAYLSEQRFLLQIFVQKDENYVYTGHTMLKFTPEELEELVRPTWEDFKHKVMEGLRFHLKLNGNNEPIITNNIKGKTDGQIGLIKLHVRDIIYDISAQHILGVDEKAEEYIRDHSQNGRFLRKPENKEKYGDTLPNGDILPKQSFWLNRDYILQYIREKAPEFLK